MASSLLGVVPAGRPNYALSYNGFTFDPATTRTNYIQSRCVPSDDGRTVKYVETTLSVHTVVMATAPATTDAIFEPIRQKLLSQAGPLKYRDKGFGDFVVNVPGSRKLDVAWGPIPKITNSKVLADSYAWEFDWTVTTCYPECDAAVFENAIMDWSYQVGYSYTDAGYESRRISGSIEIPMTRAGQANRFLRSSADDYREVIWPTIPFFFRKGSHNFELSKDRRKLSFSIELIQLRGPLPPIGVVNAKLSVDVSNDTPMNFVKWTYSFTGEFEMAYGMPRAAAAQWFMEFINAKRNEIINEAKAQQIAENGKMNNGAGRNAAKGAAQGVVIGGIIGGAIGFAMGGPIGGVLGAGKGAIAGGAIGGATGAAGGIGGGAGAAGVDVGAGGGGGAVAGGAKVGMAGANAEVAGDKKDKLPDQGKPNDNQVIMLPVTFRAGNPDFFGPPIATMSMTWSLAGTAEKIMQIAGLWTPYKVDQKHDLWVASLGNAFGPRGIPGSRFNVKDDVIVDLCRNPGQRLRNNGGMQREFWLKPGELPVQVQRLKTAINPLNSWIEWENDFKYMQDDSVAVQKTLPEDRTLRGVRRGAEERVLRTPGFAGGQGGRGNARFASLISPEDRGKDTGFRAALDAGNVPEFASQIVRMAASTYTVVMSGYAVRAGFEPSVPSLVSIAGVPAIDNNDSSLGDGVSRQVIGNCGVPVHFTAWQFRYTFPAAPTTATTKIAGNVAGAIAGAIGGGRN
jgi:hypothetical protein